MADLNQIVDQLSTLSVLEAAELVKKLEEKWGVSAAAPMAMAAMPGAGAAAAAEPVEEKTEFDVVIKDPGAKKIDVIKVIRQMTSLGLGEAKTMAETAGGKILTGVSKDAANEAKKKLEEAGATIVLESYILQDKKTAQFEPSFVLGVRSSCREDKTIVPFGVIDQEGAEFQILFVLRRGVSVGKVGFFIFKDCHKIEFIWILIHLKMIVCSPSWDNRVIKAVYCFDEFFSHARLYAEMGDCSVHRGLLLC